MRALPVGLWLSAQSFLMTADGGRPVGYRLDQSRETVETSDPDKVPRLLEAGWIVLAERVEHTSEKFIDPVTGIQDAYVRIETP